MISKMHKIVKPKKTTRRMVVAKGWGRREQGVGV
jgi:hypothetical protein